LPKTDVQSLVRAFFVLVNTPLNTCIAFATTSRQCLFRALVPPRAFPILFCALFQDTSYKRVDHLAG